MPATKKGVIDKNESHGNTFHGFFMRRKALYDG